jgi:DNA-binding NtrC family response regulator
LKPKILVFDGDHAITQQLFWTLCEDYDVVTANDLHTALKRASTYEPAVAVLDLSSSPVADSADTGLRVLEYVKDHLPKARVLGMTSEGLPAMKKKYLRLGVDELLDKPFETEQLLDFLHRLAPLGSFDAVESGASKLCY